MGGRYLEGILTPPVEGVSINVIDDVTKKAIMSTSTSSQGTYRAGPLYDDRTYAVVNPPPFLPTPPSLL
jgi:hypothetical protein